jgi:small subunit ribosomal protein S17
MMVEIKMKQEKTTKTTKVAAAACNDKDCPNHGHLKTHGRIFEGIVIRKFHKRITIEFERMIYVKKYERYAKSRTKIHARLPVCMEDEIKKGDLVKVQECRPLSKIIHFVVVEKTKNAEDIK